MLLLMGIPKLLSKCKPFTKLGFYYKNTPKIKINYLLKIIALVLKTGNGYVYDDCNIKIFIQD